MVMVVTCFAFPQLGLEHECPCRGDDLARIEAEHDLDTRVVAPADHHFPLLESLARADKEVPDYACCRGWC